MANKVTSKNDSWSYIMKYNLVGDHIDNLKSAKQVLCHSPITSNDIIMYTPYFRNISFERKFRQIYWCNKSYRSSKIKIKLKK